MSLQPKSLLAVMALAMVLVAWWLRPTGHRTSAIPNQPESAADPGMGIGRGIADRSGGEPQSLAQRPKAARHGGNKAVGDVASSRPEAALGWVSNAVRTLQVIEQLKAELPVEEENGRRQLEGLERKLFADDWRLAALLDPALDGRRAEGAFEVAAVGKEVNPAGLARTFTNTTATAPSERPTAEDVLRNHYQGRLANPATPGFSQVYEALQAHAVPEALLQGGVLMDAWTYVAARTEIAGLRAQTRASHATAARKMLEDGTVEAAPEAVRVAGFFQRVEEGMDRSLGDLESAYDRLFEWRFQEVHGLTDARAVLDALGPLELKGVNPPDLQVPAP